MRFAAEQIPAIRPEAEHCSQMDTMLIYALVASMALALMTLAFRGTRW